MLRRAGVGGAAGRYSEWRRAAGRTTTDNLNPSSRCAPRTRNRMATSNVAPPQHSSAYADDSASRVAGVMASRSCVRTRVASRLWCASRHVVSITSVPGCARTAVANALGPCFRNTSRRRGPPARPPAAPLPLLPPPPVDVAPVGSTLTSVRGSGRRGTVGDEMSGGGPVAPSAGSGPFTATDDRYRSSFSPRFCASRRATSTSGCVSMKRVVTAPPRKAGCASTLSRKLRVERGVGVETGRQCF